MDRRELSSVGLQKSHLQLLLRNGFRTVHDLRDVKPSELSSELGITPVEAKSILDQSSGSQQASSNPAALDSSASGSSSTTAPLGRSAEELYGENRKRRPIITFCRKLDSMIGGGVHVGEIIEFCGVPGIGKTQLGMQLAVDVQIPEAFHGVGGECIYIDTEGSFMVERALQMSAAVATHLKRLCRQGNRPAQVQAAAGLVDDPRAFLRGIHVIRVHDHTEQLAVVANLPTLLKQNPRVRLVVMDSVAFHFRHGASSIDFGKRTRLLSSMAQKLNELAHKHSLAVVLMNQMTTKVEAGGGGGGFGGGGGGGGGTSRLVPALGESWAHAATHRLTLFWAGAVAARALSDHHDGGCDDDNDRGMGAAAAPERLAKLIKSSCKAEGVARYTVNGLGVRDVNGPKQQQLQQQPRPPAASIASSTYSSFPTNSGPMRSTPNTQQGGQGHTDSWKATEVLASPTEQVSPLVDGVPSLQQRHYSGNGGGGQAGDVAKRPRHGH